MAALMQTSDNQKEALKTAMSELKGRMDTLQAQADEINDPGYNT